MSPDTLHGFRQAIPAMRILVVGDLMLDRYLWGQVTRISPEAPVPVVDVQRIESRPGGAANVALNLRALGARVALCGVVGQDDNGRDLLDHLRQDGFDISLVELDPSRPTTAKTRIIGNNQQVLRVDQEVREPIGPDRNAKILQQLLPKVRAFDAIVFEDYDKGVLGAELIQAVAQAARAAGVPTVVDPKFRNFMHYRDVSLFKPNLKELNEALGIRLSKRDLEGITEAVLTLRRQMPHTATLVTLSENGVLVVDADGKPAHVPAHFRKITDVSGAGDTVIAVMALGLAAKLPLVEAAALANLAGGLVCEEVGVVPIDAERLFAEAALA